MTTEPTQTPSPATPSPTVVATPAVVAAPAAEPTTPAAIAAPAAPAPEMDLETRIAKRKDELVAKLTELQANAEITAVEARDKIKARLSQLAHVVKEGVVDGWANINDATRSKLDRWLDS
jgi:3-oxoacyl-ACP reductase-like protein